MRRSSPLVVALQPATAVDDAPIARVQLIEVEQQTPYLESFAGVTAGTATTSIVRRVAGITLSSQAYAQFDNHNGDGSRATFPHRGRGRRPLRHLGRVREGPNFGVVQLALDGRPLGAPFDGYAAALGVEPPKSARHVALAEGKHILTMTVMGKHDGVDRLARRAGPARPGLRRRGPADADRGRDRRGGRHVPATLALSLGGAGRVRAVRRRAWRASTRRRRRRMLCQPPATRRSRSPIPGAWPTARSRCAQPLRVEFGKTAWTGPVSNERVPITFKQAIGANEPLRTGRYAKTLTFTLSTTNP